MVYPRGPNFITLSHAETGGWPGGSNIPICVGSALGPPRHSNMRRRAKSELGSLANHLL